MIYNIDIIIKKNKFMNYILLNNGTIMKVGSFEELKDYADDLDYKESQIGCKFEYEIMSVEKYMTYILAELKDRAERQSSQIQDIIIDLKKLENLYKLIGQSYVN